MTGPFGEDQKQALAKIGDAWRNLTPTQSDLDEIILSIENDLGADINGDGTIGAPPGTSIGTTVGPPVVTGGP